MLSARTWHKKKSQTDGAAWPRKGNGKGSGQGETVSHTVVSSLSSLTSLAVATFPPGIHLLGIRMFWGATASVNLSDGMGMDLDHYPPTVPKAPVNHC